MTEIACDQRSPEWTVLRQSVTLTSSHFGDALGVGKGKPFEYLESLLFPETESSADIENSVGESGTENRYMKHGVEYEPIINEAYQLLTGHSTRPTGFWVLPQADPLHGHLGTSPDAKVVDSRTGQCIGLAEYKAPVHCLYGEKQNPPHGIPRHYMAQVQGQMAITNIQWCDFMAVCVATKEIMLKRIFFESFYWQKACVELKTFCDILKEARVRLSQGHDPLAFPAAETLRHKPKLLGPMPGERAIRMRNLLEKDNLGRFRCGVRGPWMTFDFLIAAPVELPAEIQHYGDILLAEVDHKIRAHITASS